MAVPTTGAATSPADFGSDPAGITDRWITEIKAAEKAHAKWIERGEKIVKRYEDERGSSDSATRFNILWSNVQTLKRAYYARVPKPWVERRFKDADPVGLAASQILERCLAYQIENGDFDHGVRLAVDDLLLPGRGQLWARLETPTDPQAFMDGAPDQQVRFDYVHWTDFLTGKARVWNEVPWVARRVYMTRDQLVAAFPDCGKDVPLDYKPDDMDLSALSTPQQDVYKRAKVYEIWEKATRTVYWINKEYASKPLRVAQDPLKLRDFWPCPRPLTATTTTRSIIPIPDYYLYQDQARQLDDLTARIDKLAQALKVAGVYDASQTGVERLLNEGFENQLIPVNWVAFADRGGLKGVVDFLPIKEIAEVLASLYEARNAVKQDIYEITGISDIVRGQGVASETATAQRIKGQFATLRLDDRQEEVARFARDVLAIAGEIVAEHFDPKLIEQMSGYAGIQGADPALLPQAIALLRNDKLRGFRIDIETDSTIATDEEADKQARVEFLQSAGGFLREAAAVGAQAPEMVPLLMSMLKFGVRGFKAGRDLESEFDRTANAVQQRLKEQQSQPPATDPAAEAAAMEAQAKAQTEAQRLQIDAADKQAGRQLEAQKLQMDGQFRERELALREREMSIKESDLALRERDMNVRADLESAKMLDGIHARGEQAQREQAVAQPAMDAQSAIAELAQTVTTLVQGMQQSNEETKQTIVAAVDAMREAAMRPRTIVRDPKSGRATGIQ
jgi:hypothetical protein